MGQPEKTRFIALENGYHGETAGAMSVSDYDLYKNPYQSMLFDVHVLKNIPYVSSRNDPLWHDISEFWPDIERQLQAFKATASAIIIEPVLQGAGGMKLYSQDLLRRLSRWAKQNDIHLIADEIMTGICRTGPYFACKYAGIKPDFMCISKGITSGWLPLSAVLTTNEVYDVFYDDYEAGNNFLHSHTFTGNALAVSVALACLEVMEQDDIPGRVEQLEPQLLTHMLNVAETTGRLTNIRGIGGMVAADLMFDHPRAGFQVYQQAVKLGALLRPIGNTIYWLPPLNIEWEVLAELEEITVKAIRGGTL